MGCLLSGPMLGSEAGRRDSRIATKGNESDYFYLRITFSELALLSFRFFCSFIFTSKFCLLSDFAYYLSRYSITVHKSC